MKSIVSNIEENLYLFLGIGLFGSFGTTIAMGIVLKNFWVVLLIFFGLGAMFFAIGAAGSLGQTDVFEPIADLVIGLGAIVGAFFVAKFQGGWLWTTILITIALMIFFVWLSILENGYGISFIVVLILGFAVLIFAVMGPISYLEDLNSRLYGGEENSPKVTEVAEATPEPTETEQPTQTKEPTTVKSESPQEEETEVTANPSDETKPAPVPVGEPTLGGFFATLFSNFWGIAYLLIFVLTGQFALRKW